MIKYLFHYKIGKQRGFQDSEGFEGLEDIYSACTTSPEALHSAVYHQLENRHKISLDRRHKSLRLISKTEL